MVVTAEEVNYLIWLYLKECGFKHSAFTFANESAVNKLELPPSIQVPPGALLKIIQKGIQYVECELSVAGNGTLNLDNAEFSLLEATQPDAYMQQLMSVGKENAVGGGDADEGQKGADVDMKDLHIAKDLADRTKGRGTPAATGPEPFQIPQEKATFLKGHESEGGFNAC